MNNKGEAIILVVILMIGLCYPFYLAEKRAHDWDRAENLDKFFKTVDEVAKRDNVPGTGIINATVCDYCRILENEMLEIEENVEIVNLCPDCKEFLEREK